MQSMRFDDAVGLRGEFTGVSLGDARLDARFATVVLCAAMHPGKTFPNMFESDPGLEGAYRLMNNERVTADAVGEPHRAQTAERSKACGIVLVAHDTSAFLMTGDAQRHGLGPVGGTKQEGFFLHASLAIEETTQRPLGMAAYETWVRPRGKTKAQQGSRSGKDTVNDPTSEGRRWLRGIEASAATSGGADRVVHVMDSEGDKYWLLVAMAGGGHRFVTRLAKDRCVVSDDAEKVIEEMAAQETRMQIEVPLSERKAKTAPRSNSRSGRRTARVANIRVSASRVTLRAPRYETEVKTLEVNVVRAVEHDTPDGETPVDWILFTSEPIESDDDVLRVLRVYRARWQIEDFFKALKTGCQMEKRQLESYDALMIALSMFIPIAWHMLLLRNVARNEPSAPIETVLTPTQRLVLENVFKKKLEANATARDVLLAIAQLGGHVRHNGEPGWLVLARGVEKLAQAEIGWKAAIAFGRSAESLAVPVPVPVCSASG
jgi:hypothetical protein